MRVGITAMWAGFGPVCKGIAVAHELEARGHKIAWMLAENQTNLMADKPCGPVTLDNPGYEYPCKRWLRATMPDVMLSCASHIPLLAAEKVGIPSVVLESVGWRLERPNYQGMRDAYEKADAVCFQRFGDWPGAGLRNERLIDAVVDKRGKTQSERGNGVLLHLGGLRVRGAAGSNTGRWLNGIVRVLKDEPKREFVTVAGDGFVLGRQRWPEGVRAGQLTRLEYLDALASSRALVTVPGLTGIIEGYAYDVPVAIIPSPKREHRGNLMQLLDHGLLAMAPFSDAASALDWALDAPRGSLARIADMQGEIIQAWGTDGAEQVADVIEEVGG